MSVSGPNATAVVVTYQSAATLPAMLAAARRCRDEQVLEYIFVDNDSKDETAALLQQESTWARLMLTGANNGFGSGCNVGLAEVTTPYTIFINPDAVVEPAAIRAMTQFLDRHPQVGIVGPAITEGQGDPSTYSLQATGPRATPASVVRAATPFIARPSAAQAIVPGSEAFRTGWVCGAVFMVRTDLMRRLRGFDPRFFLYWEEVDVCRRADDLGFETWALGAAVAHHVGGASSVDDGTRIGGCIARHYYQSRRYYLIKHHGWMSATLAELAEALLLAARAVVDAWRGKGWSRLRPRLQATLFSQPGTSR